MDGGAITLLVLVISGIAAAISGGIFYNVGAYDTRCEAVKKGLASYVPDKDGAAKFTWNVNRDSSSELMDTGV